mmetsp:Transcript_27297/g.87482  ORF Transcript_27297/g.87482 Transcript_27297/m.87482 type:complete len:204 (+) Transcript_27297:1029-1640(+)
MMGFMYRAGSPKAPTRAISSATWEYLCPAAMEYSRFWSLQPPQGPKCSHRGSTAWSCVERLSIFRASAYPERDFWTRARTRSPGRARSTSTTKPSSILHTPFPRKARPVQSSSRSIPFLGPRRLSPFFLSCFIPAPGESKSIATAASAPSVGVSTALAASDPPAWAERPAKPGTDGWAWSFLRPLGRGGPWSHLAARVMEGTG